MTSPAEQTRPGLVFSPNVDIFETDREITLLADLPGIQADQLSIDLRDSVLTLSTEAPPAGNPDEEPILFEYEVGKYYRQFTLSNVIDQARIDAQLKDGVLRLTLPKVEKATPANHYSECRIIDRCAACGRGKRAISRPIHRRGSPYLRESDVHKRIFQFDLMASLHRRQLKKYLFLAFVTTCIGQGRIMLHG